MVALAVAGALFAASCGDDSGSTTADSATADTTAAAAGGSDTTGDRDGNVRVGGWGTDGTGITDMKIRDFIKTQIDTRIFRRSRTEVINGRKVVNNRDAFVVSTVLRTVGSQAESYIKVAGFDTSGDDVSRYPIAGFGKNGVVSIVAGGVGNGMSSQPTAVTLVSREILAAYYPNFNDHPKDSGLIAFYDLKTGNLATQLGTNGLTALPLDFPMSMINDIGLRAVDSDGLIHLMVAGTRSTEDGPAGPSVVVAGITPDGKLDPGVGANGVGWIQFDAVTPDDAVYEFSDLRLVDPGFSGATDRIGLVTLRTASFFGVDGERVSSDAIEFFLAKPTVKNGPVVVDPKTTFAWAFVADEPSVSILNASLAPGDKINIHYVANRYDVEEETHRIISMATSPAAYGPTNLDVGEWGDDEILPIDRNSFIADVSMEGKSLTVRNVANLADGRYETRICFDGPRCGPSDSVFVVDLVERSVLDDLAPMVTAVAVDPSGVHAVIRNANRLRRKWIFSLASLGQNGEPVQAPTFQFDASYDSSRTSEVTEMLKDGPHTYTRMDEMINKPMPLDGKRVVATRFLNPVVSLRAQTIDAAFGDTKVSTPLGTQWYLPYSNYSVRLDSRSVGLTTQYVGTNGSTYRVYKVDVDNGSVDPTFGGKGYLEFPFEQADGDDCGGSTYVSSTTGNVSMIVVDFDVVKIGDVEDCDFNFGSATVTTFAADGSKIGETPTPVDLKIAGGEYVRQVTADPSGNLYVMSRYSEEQTADQPFDYGTRIVRLTPAGKPDRTYANDGILKLSEVLSPAVTFDPEGRMYVASTLGFETLRISRYTSTGAIDAAAEVAPTTTQAKQQTASSTPATDEKRGVYESAKTIDRSEATRENAIEAAISPNVGVTVAVERPVLTAVRAVEDRSLTVTWLLSAAQGKQYVTATAMPGGRSCTSNEGSCTIRGLDPAETYTVTVALKGEDAATRSTGLASSAKPVVLLKAGRVASPTTYVRPASRGMATWKVRGGCTLNETNTRLTAPRRAAKCVLSVTTAKLGSTPKTTKSVTIVVTK